MTLSMIKTTTGYLVEGTDAAGKDVEIFYDSYASANYDGLVEAEASFHRNEEYTRRKAQIKDPERELYLEIFGAGDEPVDTVLHSTLVEPQEARNGVAIDWSQNPVTAVLRLIDQGQSARLRLINGQLVDMGPSTGGTSVSPGPVQPDDSVGSAVDLGAGDNSQQPAV